MKYYLQVKGSKKSIYSGHLNMKGQNPSGGSLDFSNYSMIKDGKPFFVISGEFHFSRYSADFWEEEILKMKACGLDTIATYLFWIHHEGTEGRFDFSGNNNIRLFVELCAKHSLQVILRIGPYAHGECRNGGLPDWLFGQPFEVRSNNTGYLEHVQRYFRKIGEQVADLVYEKGGPIIAIQLENEYMAACSPWEITVTQNREWLPQGTGGLEHVCLLKEMARAAGLHTPFMTSTGWGGSPYIDGEMLPLWGGYAYWPWLYWNHETFEHPPTSSYLFANHHDEAVQDEFDKKYPYACCEMGGGMQAWYTYRFEVEPESVEAMSLVTIAGGCNFFGYYMFHGGRNPIINNNYTNEQLSPRISYDFQAPLGDFGQTRESYKRIKLVHMMVRDFNDLLCSASPIIPPLKTEPSDTQTLRYAARSDGNQGLLFINNYQDHVEQTDKPDVQLEVETNSGTILIPRYGTMTIAKNVSAVLPFQMKLSGLSLEYATVQYITKIVDHGIPTYFFFSHPQLQGELCFSGNLTVIEYDGCTSRSVDNRLFLSIPNQGLSSFAIASPAGNIVRFVCMDRQQSLTFWKAGVKGQDYGIITSANVRFTEDSLTFEACNQGGYSIQTCPALPSAYSELSQVSSAHYLAAYTVSCPLSPLPLHVSFPYENRALLHMDPSSMEDCSEVFLHVNYEGDIGWAFINGVLVHDNIQNGTTWVIGLKAFANQLRNHDLVLYLSPKTDSVKVESTGTYAKINVSDSSKAKFHSLQLIGEKTFTLQL